MQLTADSVEILAKTRDASQADATKRTILRGQKRTGILDLSDTQIEDMGTFADYAGIVNKYKGWDLSQNYIGQVPEDFKVHSRLPEIILAENIFSSMLGFDGNIYLKILDLSNNQITKIEGLNDLPELRTLVISAN